MAHTLARNATRQEAQIIFAAGYADETDFQDVLIQICVIRVRQLDGLVPWREIRG